MTLTENLKAFFVEGELAKKAAHSLKDGREIGLKITGQDGQSIHHFTFVKENGQNTLKDGAPRKPEMDFIIPEQSAQELATIKFENISQVGLHIFEKMLSNDPQSKIHVKLHVGFLGLMTGGYLGVLSTGGADIAKFLATKGLGSAGKMKDAISKMRGGHD